MPLKIVPELTRAALTEIPPAGISWKDIPIFAEMEMYNTVFSIGEYFSFDPQATKKEMQEITEDARVAAINLDLNLPAILLAICANYKVLSVTPIVSPLQYSFPTKVAIIATYQENYAEGHSRRVY